MAVQGDVVIVEHMRGDAVDQRRIGDVATAERRDEGCKRAAVGRGQLAIDEADHRLAGAGDHHAEAIGETGLRDVPGLARNVGKREARYERTEIRRQGGHDAPSPCCARVPPARRA